MSTHIEELNKQNTKTTAELKHSEALIAESRKATIAVKKALVQKTRELQAVQDKDQKDIQQGTAKEAQLDQKIRAAQAQNKKLNMDLKKSQETLRSYQQKIATEQASILAGQQKVASLEKKVAVLEHQKR